MNTRHLLSAGTLTALLFAIICCGGPGQKNAKVAEGEKTADAALDTKSAAPDTAVTENSDTLMNTDNTNPLYEIHTSQGTITVMLYRETPLHLANFEKLVSQKFYDDILFHRVIPGFMIQVGDPLTKDTTRVNEYGTGGPGYTIPAEIKPEFTHKKGALAAARRGDMANPKRESSGSQFYIVQNAGGCSHLDGQYTVFGETVDGFDVIDKIAAMPTNHRDMPLKEVKIISINKVD